MFETYSGAILGTATLALMTALFLVNGFYQRRARRSADEILRRVPEEYNKQIMANAYICLIRRGIVGLWLLASSIYWIVSNNAFNYYLLAFLTIGTVFVIWGILGFKNEKKRLIFLD